jgi:hypothetical protein
MTNSVLALRAWRIAALVLLMFGTSCAPSAPILKIESSSSPIHVGDTVTISIKAENIANLTATEIHLSFNINVLEVVQLNDGSFITADFPVQNTFDNSAGTIDYAVAQINRAPANGSGVLFEIVFRAKATGDSPISFRETQASPAGALLSDSNGTAIQVSLTGGNVSVSQP